jgi:hypothetical protein
MPRKVGFNSRLVICHSLQSLALETVSSRTGRVLVSFTSRRGEFSSSLATCVYSQLICSNYKCRVSIRCTVGEADGSAQPARTMLCINDIVR